MINIIPLGPMIIIKEIEDGEKTTKSGIVLAATIQDEVTKRGIVVAKGDGDHDPSGNHYDIPLDLGDTVIYSPNHATEIEEDGEKYFFVNWRQLLGKKLAQNNG